MTTRELTTAAPESTVALGRWLGKRLPRRCVVPLLGPIGAGKTWLARGICEGYGMLPETPFASPTYTLLHTYPSTRGPIHHFDFFRLSSEEEIEAIGFWEWLEDEALVLIEWPEAVLEELPARRLEIELSIPGAGDHRRIRFRTPDPQLAALIEELDHAHSRD